MGTLKIRVEPSSMARLGAEKTCLQCFSMSFFNVFKSMDVHLSFGDRLAAWLRVNVFDTSIAWELLEDEPPHSLTQVGSRARPRRARRC